MSFCSMLTWLDSFCSNGLFYILLLFFCISWLPSLGLCILVSKEPGERQLPKQDEPMEAVPCSPGGNGGGVGSLLPTSFIFMRLHVILYHFVVCWLGWMHFVATVSFTFFYILLLLFCISWPPSLGLWILVSKEPGERQLPKQDEPMEAVPCSPGGMGRSGVTANTISFERGPRSERGPGSARALLKGSKLKLACARARTQDPIHHEDPFQGKFCLLPTSFIFMRLHVILIHFVVCWLGWMHRVKGCGDEQDRGSEIMKQCLSY